MKKIIFAISLVALVALSILFLYRHAVADFVFPTCSESGWGAMLIQQCECNGFQYNVTPNVYDYSKSVCIGVVEEIVKNTI